MQPKARICFFSRSAEVEYGDALDVIQAMDLPSCWLDIRQHDSEYCTIRVRLRLLGGKGGFGSQLRAQGSKMSSKKRSGNYEACRDLAGRRIRTQTQAQKIADYLLALPELERQKREAVKDKMIETIDKAERRRPFADIRYVEKSKEAIENTEYAVLKSQLERQKPTESPQKQRFSKKRSWEDDGHFE